MYVPPTNDWWIKSLKIRLIEIWKCMWMICWLKIGPWGIISMILEKLCHPSQIPDEAESNKIYLQCHLWKFFWIHGLTLGNKGQSWEDPSCTRDEPPRSLWRISNASPAGWLPLINSSPNQWSTISPSSKFSSNQRASNGPKKACEHLRI